MFAIPSPELQVEFSLALAEIRGLYLQEALQETVSRLKIADLDVELGRYVPDSALKALAAKSLRGEIVFPVPILLAENPHLLGYYRLLYGYSQKLFYNATTGVASFKSMEERGVIPRKRIADLPKLCEALIIAGCALIEGVGAPRISAPLLDDLSLLTVGPQLRGGANVKTGARGIVKVFEAIHEIVKASVVEASDSHIVVKNAAKRLVRIEFAPDPDIVIREEMSKTESTFKIAIEVKAGSDFSNVHNRLGEAEKSHQKAKARGYVECWTVLNVDKYDTQTAKQESPSTNRFYLLTHLISATGPEYKDFRTRIRSLTGIA